MDGEGELTEIAARVVELARSQGATVAEARVGRGWELTTKVRLGEPELVKEAGHRGLSLRVFLGQHVATTATSDLSDSGIVRCVTDALELVHLSEADEFAGPAPAALLTKPPFLDLDLFDSSIAGIDAQQALALATEAESAALAFDPRITLSEGATFSRVSGESVLLLSSGFTGYTRGSYASLSVAPVANDTDGKKRRGSHWTAKRHYADLESAKSVGEEAARRTVRQLGARKVATQQVPVVFSQEAARSIIGLLAGSVLGGAHWRKSTYLLDREGQSVASEHVTLLDDPHIPRGPGSRAFDGEGLLSRKNLVVERGVLKTILLDSYSARKLKRETTASAVRSGASVSASTSNFVMSPGADTEEALINGTGTGLYVTEMMGFGFNAITGDFSRGASGFWIENGQLAFPVAEVTISGNLNEMLHGIDGVANNTELLTSITAPSFRVAQMTLSGT